MITLALGVSPETGGFAVVTPTGRIELSRAEAMDLIGMISDELTMDELDTVAARCWR